jgi:hypothetical protein
LRKTSSKEFEEKKVCENEVKLVSKRYKYEATNIGHAYDSRYWSWVRMIGEYRAREEEENFSAKIREAKAIMKS